MTVCRQCGSANDVGVTTCFKCGGSLIAPHMVGKIACQVHTNREATTSCSSCGAMLCDACAYTLNGIDFCEACAPDGAISEEHDEDYEAIPVLNTGQSERATFFSRLLASLLDLGVVALVALAEFLVFLLLNKASWRFVIDGSPLGFAYYTAVFLSGLAYPAIWTAMEGQTLGKYFARIIVLQPDGRIIPLTTSMLRAGAMVISALPLGLGFLWALWDPQSETWHDKISKTYAFRYQDTT